MARSDDETQIALRMPRALHERLKEAAGGNVSEEIRRRLEASFQIDEPTEQLMGALNKVATSLAIDGGWHEDPFLFDVFCSAVTTLLDHWRPTKAPEQPPTYRMIPAGVSAEAAGQMLAHFSTPGHPAKYWSEAKGSKS
jgi:hypothetical protein